jgi:hypothetical protein
MMVAIPKDAHNSTLPEFDNPLKNTKAPKGKAIMKPKQVKSIELRAKYLGRTSILSSGRYFLFSSSAISRSRILPSHFGQ